MGAYDATSYGSHLFFSMIRVGLRHPYLLVTSREINTTAYQDVTSPVACRKTSTAKSVGMVKHYWQNG